ncbi:hypothetical protein MZV36_27725 [Escherichia coli]|uniref:hypothetical protein n=1 Tax=Escherichia coli TaxID=562 RepID=UPI00345AC1DA
MTPQQSALKAASHKASQKIVARDQRSDDRFVCLTASFSNVSMPFRRVRFTRTRRKGMDTLLKDAVRQTKRSSERWSRATIFWLALCDAAFRADCCGVTCVRP